MKEIIISKDEVHNAMQDFDMFQQFVHTKVEIPMCFNTIDNTTHQLIEMLKGDRKNMLKLVKLLNELLDEVYKKCLKKKNKGVEKMMKDIKGFELNQMKNIDNWKEITRGLYRYVVGASTCYEIHINIYKHNTPVLMANASLFFSWRMG